MFDNNTNESTRQGSEDIGHRMNCKNHVLVFNVMFSIFNALLCYILKVLLEAADWNFVIVPFIIGIVQHNVQLRKESYFEDRLAPIKRKRIVWEFLALFVFFGLLFGLFGGWSESWKGVFLGLVVFFGGHLFGYLERVYIRKMMQSH